MPVIFLFLILVAISAYSGVRKKGNNPLWTQREVNKIVGGSYVSSDDPANQYVSSVNRQAMQRSVAPAQPVNRSYSVRNQSEEQFPQMPKEPETSQILGDVSDLMVKGYDGNMTFERDFLGEAMDMINSFLM